LVIFATYNVSSHSNIAIVFHSPIVIIKVLPNIHTHHVLTGFPITPSVAALPLGFTTLLFTYSAFLKFPIGEVNLSNHLSYYLDSSVTHLNIITFCFNSVIPPLKLSDSYSILESSTYFIYQSLSLLIPPPHDKTTFTYNPQTCSRNPNFPKSPKNLKTFRSHTHIHGSVAAPRDRPCAARRFMKFWQFPTSQNLRTQGYSYTPSFNLFPALIIRFSFKYLRSPLFRINIY